MKIDKKSFLLLTAALAGGAAVAIVSACTVTSTTNSGTDGGTADANPGIDAISPGTDSATNVDTGVPVDSAAEAAAETGPSCDDSVTDGGPVNCSTGLGTDAGLDGGCGADPRANGFCSGLELNLKAEPAQSAIDCFAAGPACEGLGPCIAGALAAACPDPTAPSYCASVAAACADAGTAPTAPDGGTFESACETVASGMTSAGRAAFQTCYVESAGCGDPSSCFEALAQ